MCTAAGIPVAGGHSIDSPEPIYGLVAIGLVDPSRVIRNSTARAGDQIILTKRSGRRHLQRGPQASGTRRTFV